MRRNETTAFGQDMDLSIKQGYFKPFSTSFWIEWIPHPLRSNICMAISSYCASNAKYSKGKREPGYSMLYYVVRLATVAKQQFWKSMKKHSLAQSSCRWSVSYHPTHTCTLKFTFEVDTVRDCHTKRRRPVKKKKRKIEYCCVLSNRAKRLNKTTIK